MLHGLIDNLPPEFRNMNRRRSLETELAKAKIAEALWISIETDNQSGCQTSLGCNEQPFESDGHIRNRILRSLEFEDMEARENQIETPFPKTFQWLLDNGDVGNGSVQSSGRSPKRFKEWLESQDNETPFWITGKPASGKSTLLKFICKDPQVETHLQVWSGQSRLLLCSVYFWNPGSSEQKSQVGLLHSLLHQLVRQRPDLCRVAIPRRHFYFQLTGADAIDPPAWTLNELGDSISRFVSEIEEAGRLAIFVDGLDEYEGNVEELISFFTKLNYNPKVKICVSSRPVNKFRDEFCTYPSLRMEPFTKPDIEEYVRAQSQIIEKAEGVFLWVVLVVEKLIATAQENNDLRVIWEVFDTLPPGLERLYESMREHLHPAHRKSASIMYQLLFRWKKSFPRADANCSVSLSDFSFAMARFLPQIREIMDIGDAECLSVVYMLTGEYRNLSWCPELSGDGDRCDDAEDDLLVTIVDGWYKVGWELESTWQRELEALERQAKSTAEYGIEPWYPKTRQLMRDLLDSEKAKYAEQD
ncbi:hypothetical protein QBC35DRAFT_534999 [Podospora australis]|uniref:Nephrocystin 3-like N-terminal domain-containing protein n=1 Tax=Podospora australis TaxID=1536484 RepID=A0AAN7AFZ6_9PEZI|nr:hypothetical protein QBC35DRAFT_534999 [Podospora australis]